MDLPRRAGRPPPVRPDPGGPARPPRGWGRFGPFLEGILLLGVIAWMAGTNLAWLGQHRFPPQGDYAFHLVESASFHAALTAPSSLPERLAAAWTWPGPYPPGVYAVTSCVYALLGPGIGSALASQQAFVPVLLAGVYLLVRQRFGWPSAAAASLLAAASPLVLQVSRQYLLDFPLAAMVAAGLFLLVRSDGFRRRRTTLLLGVVGGAGMLVKFTFFWFLGVPVALTLGAALLRWRRSPRHLAVQAALGLVLAVAALFLAAQGRQVGPEILAGGDLVTGRSWFLAISVLAAAAGGWLLASRAWGRAAERDPSLVNAVQAACLAWVVAAPWYLANQAILASRWAPVASHRPDLGLVASQWFQDLSSGAPGWPALGLFALGLVGALATLRNPVCWTSLAALASGGAATLLVLGLGERYLVPLQPLAAVAAVAGVSALPAARPVVLVLAAMLALGSLAPPSLVQALPPLQSLAGLAGRHRADSTEGFQSDYEAGDELYSVLVGGLHAGEGRVAILLDPARPGRAHEVWYALQADAGWDGAPLIPIVAEAGPRGVAVHQLNPYEVPRLRWLLSARGLDPSKAPPPAGAPLEPGSVGWLVDPGGDVLDPESSVFPGLVLLEAPPALEARGGRLYRVRGSP